MIFIQVIMMVKITYECEKCGQDDFDDEEYAEAHED